MENFALPFVLSLTSGLIIMLGGWIFSSRHKWDEKHLDLFIALGAGYILAVAFLDMIPEAFKTSPYSMHFVIVGYLVVHLFEHVLHRISTTEKKRISIWFPIS